MSRLIKAFVLLVVFILPGLSACGGSAPTPTATSDAIYTQLAQTAAVALVQTASAVPATPTVTPTPSVSPTPGPTHTPLLSPTPGPSQTPLLSSTPGPSQTPLSGGTSATPVAQATQHPVLQASCDNFTFTDVTYPDGSQVPAGSVFVKTWAFTNIGPCSWNQSYSLIYGWETDGAGWEGAGPIYLNKVVNVGDTINLSVTLRAPTKVGGYAAWFRLQNDKGYNFGPIFAVSVLVK